MANFSTSNKRKRGRAADKLSVRLFLLDPEKETTKVTKEIGSKKGKNELIAKGCGPPRPEHCIAGETVEFSFDLTNVEFRQKIVEIYPILENGFFVFMIAGKHNALKELNPGRCCYRCYTPENVYHSERGQGRLYIRKIAENQISPCNHGISARQRFGFTPILPKQSIATSTSVTSERQTNDVSSPSLPTNQQLPVLGNFQTESRMSVFSSSSVAPIDLSSSLIVISEGESSQAHSTVSTPRQLIPSSIGEIGLTSPPHNSVNMVTQNMLPSSTTIPIVFQMGPIPSVYSPANAVPQHSRPPVFSTNAMATVCSSRAPGVLGKPPTPSMVSPVTMTTLTPSTYVLNSNTMTLGPSPSLGALGALPTASMAPSHDCTTSSAAVNSSTVTTPGLSPLSSDPLLLPPAGVAQSVVRSTPSLLPTPVTMAYPNTNNFGSHSAIFNTQEFGAANLLSSQSPALHALADVTVDRGPISDIRSLNNPPVQENLGTTEPQLSNDAVLENIRSTGKLEMSVTILDNDHVLKKLEESASNIHTVEIQSACKLEEVLEKYSLPQCLKFLRITENILDYKDVLALVRSSSIVKKLHELDLSRTKFEEYSFSLFSSVLDCSDVQRLYLTDIGLAERERKCLVIVLNSMNNLKNVNLSKNKLTDAQANDILHKYGESKTVVSLDLSQNALQGDKIIGKILKLKSLKGLNLSHNHIRFPHWRCIDEGSDNFLTKTRHISLSSNNMTCDDICVFPSLIRSNLVSLNLASNHVGCSIWSLCSLTIDHLKVLSLANSDVCGLAVQGLIKLLSSATELEELDLSSNNLMLEDFEKLLSPLLSLTQLKKLNLNNNPDGVSVVLEKILPCMKWLEELRLSNTHLNGEDCNKFFESLKSLKQLKYLDLSNNAIGSLGARALADILNDFLLLEGLNLSKCCIQEDEMSALCFVLKLLKKLKYLNLSGNMMNAAFFDVPLCLSVLEEIVFPEFMIAGSVRMCLNDLKLLVHLKKLDLSQTISIDGLALAKVLPSLMLLEKLTLGRIMFRHNELSNAIGKLNYLKELNLQCSIEGLAKVLPLLQLLEELEIPYCNESNKQLFDAVRELKYLKRLKLCYFVDARTDLIPLAEALPSLLFLEQLELVNIKLDVGSETQLFRAVEKLKYLKKLRISGAKITQLAIVALMEMLPSLQLLESLVLEVTGFDREGESDTQLFHAVGKLKYLKELNLSAIKITPQGVVALTDILPSLPLLEKLVLGKCDLDRGNDEQLFYALVKLKYLKHLDLLYAKITPLGVEALIKILPSLQLLENLVFGKINFDSGSEARLFQAVGKLLYLKFLFVSLITITPPGAEALAQVLPSLQLLETLNLGEIEFSQGKDPGRQLFHAVGKLKYLRILHLWRTKITETHTMALADVLPSLHWLEQIYLEVIKFDEGSETQMFHALGKLKCLKKLGIYKIRITQTDAEALAKAFSSLQLLEVLLLEKIDFDNEIDTNLFHAVKKLKYLKTLSLRYTKITQASAKILTKVLPTLLNLRAFRLPIIQSDESETDDEENDKNETPLSKLRAAAQRIRGLYIYNS